MPRILVCTVCPCLSITTSEPALLSLSSPACFLVSGLHFISEKSRRPRRKNEKDINSEVSTGNYWPSYAVTSLPKGRAIGLFAWSIFLRLNPFSVTVSAYLRKIMTEKCDFYKASLKTATKITRIEFHDWNWALTWQFRQCQGYRKEIWLLHLGNESQMIVWL